MTLTTNGVNAEKDFQEHKDDDKSWRTISDAEEEVDSNKKVINQQLAYDRLINVEAQLELGDSLVNGKVTGRSLGLEGATSSSYD